MPLVVRTPMYARERRPDPAPAVRRPILASEKPRVAGAPRNAFRLGSIPYSPVPEPPVQRVAEPAPDHPQGLPPALRQGVEALSGLDMSDVRVRRDSGEAARLGALAYARGSEIHLGPGQGHHLPHEAWHVVQQKQDRVRPTGKVAGMALNDDAALEAEADRMGARSLGAAVGDRLVASTERPPPTVVQRTSDVERSDKVVREKSREIYEELAEKYTKAGKGKGIPSRLSIAAAGSYGRKELTDRSDLDFIIVTSNGEKGQYDEFTKEFKEGLKNNMFWGTTRTAEDEGSGQAQEVAKSNWEFTLRSVAEYGESDGGGTPLEEMLAEYRERQAVKNELGRRAPKKAEAEGDFKNNVYHPIMLFVNALSNLYAVREDDKALQKMDPNTVERLNHIQAAYPDPFYADVMAALKLALQYRSEEDGKNPENLDDKDWRTIEPVLKKLRAFFSKKQNPGSSARGRSGNGSSNKCKCVVM